jgi:hypothetical protein
MGAAQHISEQVVTLVRSPGATMTMAAPYARCLTNKRLHKLLVRLRSKGVRGIATMLVGVLPPHMLHNRTKHVISDLKIKHFQGRVT